MRTLSTNHGNLRLPAFFPDATLAHVRTLDTEDLKNCGVHGLVVNAYHLYKLQKGELIKKLGGIHRFMNWNDPIITDSGGWQVMSLIHDSPKESSISEKEIVFFDQKSRKKIIFTPELSIKLQLQLNPDIMICLDDCTRPDMGEREQEKSVELTIAWAKRCKREFERLLSFMFSRVIPAKAGILKTKKKIPDRASLVRNDKRPLLFAVIQGGNSKSLRKQCATELLKIGFDGFSFGGHPINEEGQLVEDIMQFTADLIPNNLPKYAMGVGTPADIVKSVKMGYNMFDCVIPTREARHKKLYIFKGNLDSRGLERRRTASDFRGSDFYEAIHINTKFANDPRPIDETCDCLTCKNYTRAYVYHLLQLQEPAALRLATIHNLRFYARLMENLQK